MGRRAARLAARRRTVRARSGCGSSSAASRRRRGPTSTTLRLPERHLAVAAEPASRAYGPGHAGDVGRPPPLGRVAPARRTPTHGDGEPARWSATCPSCRTCPSSGGRRTADETAQFASVGRRAPRRRPSRRRRRPAPRAGDRRVRRRSAAAAPRGRAPAASPARRRARRRRPRTGCRPRGRSPPRRAAGPPAAGRPAGRRPAPPSRPLAPDGWTAPRPACEPELLTRPMRLSDHVPHARRPRRRRVRRGV